MPDPGSFDDELRRMARRSTDETASTMDVDAELDAVHDRIAGRVAVTPIPSRPDQRLMWLSAAAVTVLVVGVVAAVATRDRGETLQPGADITEPVALATSTTMATATVTALSTTTVPPDSTTTSLLDTTTTSPATTVPDEAAPPPATTTVPVVQTTTTTTTLPTTVTSNECWREPVPPPSLADGSPVGEAVVVDADKGVGTETYRWGEGEFAVTQRVGVEPDPSGMPEGFDIDEWGVRHGDWRGFGEGSDGGPLAAWLINDADGCSLRYELELRADRADVAWMTEAWAASLGADVPIPDGRHPELPAPVPYLSSHPTVDAVFDSDVGERALTIHEFDVDGTPIGTGTADDAVEFPVDLGESGRLRLDGERSWFECTGAPIVGTDERIAELVGPAEATYQSIAGSPSGVVVAVRQVCTDDEWGNPDSFAEIVRFGPDGVEVIKEIRPDPTNIFAGVWSARTLSPDGRYLGVWESTSIEEVRYHVLDTVDSSPGEPLEIGGSCPDAGDIVGAPRFVGDGLVVLARRCGGDASELTVDVVDLESGAVIWGSMVENGTSSSYNAAIDGLSAVLIDGEVWILVTSGGFENPGRTMLVTESRQAEVTRLGGFRNYAFTVEDLLIN